MFVAAMKLFEACPYSERLITKLKSLDYDGNLALSLIKKAITFAKYHHEGQLRKSGEPFYTHPLEVAYMVSDYSLSTEVIATSILHDVVEDTKATIENILDEFGFRISQMVNRLTRNLDDGSKIGVQELLEYAYEKGDHEVLLIKIIDRLHNLQTIECMPTTKQMDTFCEAVNHFLLYSFYLEDLRLVEQLENLCFHFFKQSYEIEVYENLHCNNYQSVSQAVQNGVQPKTAPYLLVI